MRKSFHLLSFCVFTCKMGGTPGKSVSEAAVRNSSSTIGEMLCKDPTVMQIYGTVTVNSDNGTHPYRRLTWGRHCSNCFMHINSFYPQSNPLKWE